jgi:hypothetical protein
MRCNLPLFYFNLDWARCLIYVVTVGNEKHLKAIEKGKVPPRGGVGLVDSQEEGYDLKSKILGKGGDRRFHAMFMNEVLHFPGLTTEH